MGIFKTQNRIHRGHRWLGTLLALWLLGLGWLSWITPASAGPIAILSPESMVGLESQRVAPTQPASPKSAGESSTTANQPGVPLYPYSASLWEKFDQFRNDPQLQRLVEEDLEKSLVIRQVIQDEVDRTFNHTTTLLNVLLVVLTAIPILTAGGFWFIRRSVINQVLAETRKQLQDEVQQQFGQEVEQEIKAQTDRFTQEIKALRDEFSAQLQQLNSDAQQEKDGLIQELTQLLPSPTRESTSPELQQKLQTLTRQLDTLKSTHKKLQFTARDYLEQGKALYFEEAIPDALAAFDQALALEPQNARAFFYKGMCLAKTQQHSAALVQYDQGLAIATDLPELWLAKGNALLRLQQIPDAIASYDQATCLKPDFYQAWFAKARSHALNEDTDMALEALAKAIQLNPDRCREAAKGEAAFDRIRELTGFKEIVGNPAP